VLRGTFRDAPPTGADRLGPRVLTVPRARRNQLLGEVDVAALLAADDVIVEG
jgi:hypothetical protein